MFVVLAINLTLFGVCVFLMGGSEGSHGTVTNYLGKLEWQGNRGITSVDIANGGSKCLADGRLAAVGGGGDGFDAEFEILSTIPDVVVADGGERCWQGKP